MQALDDEMMTILDRKDLHDRTKVTLYNQVLQRYNVNVDTVPKTMQAKAKRLMEHLKRDISWTARGELIHEGVPVAGSKVVDLVNDLLRKRKTDSTGWQPFARQLRAMNLPMELVGNVARRAYIRQMTTPTPGRVHSTVCVAMSDPQDTRFRRRCDSLRWTLIAC